MLDPERLGYAVVIVLVFAFIAWFGIGTELNRRKVLEMARWAREGVRPFAGKASIRTIGTSAFDILVESARDPFSQLTVTVVLESREMPFVWLWNRVKGRTDFLLVRSDLRHRPQVAADIFWPGSIVSGDARKEIAADGWAMEEAGDGRLTVGHPVSWRADICHELLAITGDYRPYVERLAVRRHPPHLVAGFSLAAPGKRDPSVLFNMLKRIATSVAATADMAGDEFSTAR